ncbi:MAG: glycosyltransferase [Chitinophagales bacterium]
MEGEGALVAIVIVTYGDRWVYLSQNLSAWKNQDHARIILINNGTTYDLDAKLRMLDMPYVHVLDQGSNKGSAEAFGIGIEFCTQLPDVRYIWLLDDDNISVPETLHILLHEAKMLEERGERQIALMCNRTNRKYIARTISGEPLWRNFRPRNAFLGFHIFNVFRSKKPKPIDLGSAAETTALQIPYAPYGGFFFSCDLASVVGLPDRRFFLYADDFEYTHRFVKIGVPIYLIPEAVVRDAEPTWQQKKGKWKTQFLDEKSNKVFYTTRNYIFFQRREFVSNPVIYHLNRYTFVFFLFLLAVVKGRSVQFKRFARAMHDGLAGVFDNTKYPL